MESIDYPPFLVHDIDISLILKHFQDFVTFFFEFIHPDKIETQTFGWLYEDPL